MLDLFSLFGVRAKPSYKGSNLARLVANITSQAFDLSETGVERFGVALRGDYPQAAARLAQSLNKPPLLFDDEKLTEISHLITARVCAIGGLRMIDAAAKIAPFYGAQADRSDINAHTALMVALGLVEYASACSLPFSASDGGYRRYLSGYLVLREAMIVFGLSEPWEMHLKQSTIESEGKRLTFHDHFTPDFTRTLRAFVPPNEQAILAAACQQLANCKTAVGWMSMLPGMSEIYLQMVLSAPQLFVTAPWSGHLPQLYSGGRCSLCAGLAPCRPCETVLIQIALTSRGGNYRGLTSAHVGSAGERAAGMLADVGINPYR